MLRKTCSHEMTSFARAVMRGKEVTALRPLLKRRLNKQPLLTEAVRRVSGWHQQ